MAVILCETQLRQVERLLQVGIGGQDYLPTVLLIGPPGAGKRTVARATAQKLDMEFIEVPLGGPARSIAERLAGVRNGADLSSGNSSPTGELGRTLQTLVYLSNLQFLDPALFQVVHKLMSTRSYVDTSGNEWRTSEDMWLVAGLSFPVEQPYTVGPEHWLCTAFQRRVVVEVPSSADDLFTLSRSVAADYPSETRIDPIVGDTLAEIPMPRDNLHAIRRWAEWIANHSQGEMIGSGLLRRAVLDDLKWVLPRIQYRGHELSVERFRQWSDQFPPSLQTTAAHIVCEIAERYHIGPRRYFDALADLIRDSGIARRDRVAFCKWQGLGRSAPRVAHDLKNQARWRPTSEIDLGQTPRDWPDLNGPEPCSWIIVADDFVGSGKTLSRLSSVPNSALKRLLDAYPHAHVRILIVAGFEEGVRELRSTLVEFQERVELLVGLLFRSEDRCFTRDSRIFPDATQSSRLRDFCIEAARRHYPALPLEMRLGHGGIGCLTVFFDTVPNNSLPLLWHDEGTWLPLFPASGLPPS